MPTSLIVCDRQTLNCQPSTPPSLQNGGRSKSPQCEDTVELLGELHLLDPYVPIQTPGHMAFLVVEEEEELRERAILWTKSWAGRGLDLGLTENRFLGSGE